MTEKLLPGMLSNKTNFNDYFRLQKDVALISLANVLHRARYSNEAAVVVHAALDVSKELNVNHFTLGNIYAVRFYPSNFKLAHKFCESITPKSNIGEYGGLALECHTVSGSTVFLTALTSCCVIEQGTLTPIVLVNTKELVALSQHD